MPTDSQKTTMADKTILEKAYQDMVLIHSGEYKVDIKKDVKAMTLEQIVNLVHYLKHDRTTLDKKILKMAECIPEFQNLKKTKDISK